MKKLYLLLLAGLLFAACNRDGEIFSESENQEDTAQTRSAFLADASDPYNLNVMQSAVNAVFGNNKVRLDPSDYYVRFLPKDSVEMDALLSLKIEIFDHPLDNMTYVPDCIGEDFEESDAPVYDWVYSVVPTDFVFPAGIEYEIIYGVHIKRDRPGPSSADGQLTDAQYKEVLKKAMQLTGNTPATRADEAEETEWTPSARFRFNAGDLDTLALEGAKVRVRNYTNIYTKYTDNTGSTGNISTITGPVSYEIVWERDYWTLEQVVNGWGKKGLIVSTFPGPLNTALGM